ncbi:MAG: hypothetical protein WCO04_01460 [Pseudomonadota bacterium]|jgi:hypothetical protein
MKKYIIIDLNTNKALYALQNKTIMFSTLQAATEFGNQMCNSFLAIEIII